MTVDDVTVSQLSDAVRAGDAGRAKALLQARPALVNMEGPGGGRATAPALRRAGA